MKTATNFIKALEKKHPAGFDLSLDRITALLAKLGNPQNNMPPTIHVAGTNGKGSVIAFCKAILQNSGLSVNVHVSPHLINWHERYFLQKNYVTDKVLLRCLEYVAKTNDGKPSTVFEMLSAVMFVLFNKYRADVCLVEVGLGGRFDATNAMAKSAVQVITPIGFDHEAWLGDTLAKIAFEKAGIMKKNSIVISAKQKKSAREVLQKRAKQLNCQFLLSGKDYFVKKYKNKFIWQNKTLCYELPLPSLLGEHQIENAATAISACVELLKKMKKNMPTQEMLSKAMQNVIWAGRLQKFNNKKLLKTLPNNSEIWLDGGHNPHAGKALAKFLQQHIKTTKKKLIIITAMLNTKDSTAYFRTLASLQPTLYAISGKSINENFYSETQLTEQAKKAGLHAIKKNNFNEAINEIKKEKKEICLIISGSLYLIGDILKKYH